MERVYDVMAAGHLCLDVIPRIPDTGADRIENLLRPGKLVNIGEAAMGTGGSVSNTGRSMQRLGANVCYCARVGGDAFGRITMDILRAAGNPDGIRVVEDAASSYTIVVAPPRIDRIFLHNTGTNDAFGAEDVDAKLLAQCRLFHFGYPTLMRRMFESDGEELRRLFQTAKFAGASTSLDVTLPDPSSDSGKANWREIFKKTLPYVDIFLPSVEEVYYMLYPDEFLRKKEEHRGAELIDFITREDLDRLSGELLSMGVRIAAIKLGPRGFYLRTASEERLSDMGAGAPTDAKAWANRELWAPALAIDEIASANGAGDSAIAGFLTAMLKGLSVEDALQCAVCVGWQNLHALDAVSGVRSWPETLELCAAGMPTIEPGIPADQGGWTVPGRVWAGPVDQRA